MKKFPLLRLLLLAGAWYYTVPVKTWIWYHVPPYLQPLSWSISGYLWVGAAALLLFGLPLLGKAFNSVRSNLWNTGPGRWLIGRFAGFMVVAVQLVAVWVVIDGLTGDGHRAAIAALAATIPVLLARRRAKILIGRVTRPFRRMTRDAEAGFGGSARMAGLLDEWDNPWRPGQILLGTSMFDRKWKVGIKDDRHFVTVATSRSGKGAASITPNILLWPHDASLLVIDPKGQNAAITGEARRKKGQSVYIVDAMTDGDTARYNPMADISPALIDYNERIGIIAEAIIVSSGSGNSAFFERSARMIISGLIDTVIRSDVFRHDEKHLGMIREVMINPKGLPTAIMEKLGGLAGAAAALLKRASDKAGGDVFATILEQTQWLDSPSIQKVLSASDFKLEDLRNGRTTVYLVVPPQYLDVHSRFLRLFVNLALAAAGEGKKGKHLILFIFDEFYALGRLEMISKASGIIAGSGVKIWPILQNLGQLQELFPKNWETFLGNAGQWQIFAVNDKTTAEYVSDMLGRRIMWKRVEREDGEEEWEPGRLASLRDAPEFMANTSRGSGRQIVFTEGGKAFLLRRDPYFEQFKETEYSPDPYEARRTSWWSNLSGIAPFEAFKLWLFGEEK